MEIYYRTGLFHKAENKCKEILRFDPENSDATSLMENIKAREKAESLQSDLLEEAEKIDLKQEAKDLASLEIYFILHLFKNS